MLPLRIGATGATCEHPPPDLTIATIWHEGVAQPEQNKRMNYFESLASSFLFQRPENTIRD